MNRNYSLLRIAFVLAIGVSLSALLLLPPRAPASTFSFSTGMPDGKIGTLSRPASNGLIQTETADDFVLSECVLINGATFTGLLTSVAAVPSTITDVEVEIYHVFPVDSDTSRTPAVPTRQNSPSDVEIDDATRDSLVRQRDRNARAQGRFQRVVSATRETKSRHAVKRDG